MRSLVRFLGFVILLVVLGLGAYSLYDALYGPEKVVLRHSTVTITSISNPGKPVKRPIRLVERGSDNFWEVQLKSGLWHDCGGDCAEAYRREELEPWETRKEEAPR